MTLTRIGPASLGKILGGLYAVLGLVFGALFALAAAGLRALMPLAPLHLDSGDSSGFYLLLFLPPLYGALGFFTGAFFALVYNWMARLFGGIEIELRDPAGEALSAPRDLPV